MIMVEAKWRLSFIHHYAGICTPETRSIYAQDEMMTAFDMSFDRAQLISRIGPNKQTESEYPKGFTLSLVLVGLLMAIFLVCRCIRNYPLSQHIH